MILRLLALSANIFTKETMLTRRISACLSSSSRPHVGEVGAAPGATAEVLVVSTRNTILGASAWLVVAAGPPPIIISLSLSVASLARASATLEDVLFLCRMLAGNWDHRGIIRD